jgi:hypothetical protein
MGTSLSGAVFVRLAVTRRFPARKHFLCGCFAAAIAG